MVGLIEKENDVVREMEFENVRKIKKLLMMSVNGKLHIHALRLIKKELGLPENFRESIIGKYSGEFKLVDLEIVALVENDNRDESLGVANVEAWRENEYREKWLSEFETKYAFPIKFPTGFKIKPGFKERLRNWQRLPYVKPYERREEGVRIRTCGGIERFEKRAVAILHELLALTVEKMLEVERLVHFKKDFGVEVNFRELILKHPGIFYISTKGSTQMVFLREAYCGDCLVEPNPVYVVRRKMLDFILLGRRNTRESRDKMEVRDERNVVPCNQSIGGIREGDFVIPILEYFDDDGSVSDNSSGISG